MTERSGLPDAQTTGSAENSAWDHAGVLVLTWRQEPGRVADGPSSFSGYDSGMAGNGDNTTSISRAGVPASRIIPGRGRGWYRGDFHVHSQRSHGGELTPEQLVVAARERGLDFMAITEHNSAEGHGEWEYFSGDDLLVIPGQEVI